MTVPRLGHLVRIVEITGSNPPISFPDYCYIKVNTESSNQFTLCDRHVLDTELYAGLWDVEWLETFPPSEDPEEPTPDPILHIYTFVATHTWERALMRNAVKIGLGSWIGANDTVQPADSVYEFANGYYSASIGTTIEVFDPLVVDTSSVFAWPIGITDGNIIYNRIAGVQPEDPTGTIVRVRNFTDNPAAAVQSFTLEYNNPGPANGVDHVGSGSQDYVFWRYLDSLGNPSSTPPNLSDSIAQYKKAGT